MKLLLSFLLMLGLLFPIVSFADSPPINDWVYFGIASHTYADGNVVQYRTYYSPGTIENHGDNIYTVLYEGIFPLPPVRYYLFGVNCATNEGAYQEVGFQADGTPFNIGPYSGKYSIPADSIGSELKAILCK